MAWNKDTQSLLPVANNHHSSQGKFIKELNIFFLYNHLNTQEVQQYQKTSFSQLALVSHLDSVLLTCY